MGKYAKFSRKYVKSWEMEQWAIGWLTHNLDENNLNKEAFCTVCKNRLRAHKSDLVKHTETKIHQKNMKALNPTANKQSTLNEHVVIQITNDEKERDISFSVYIAMHSSIRSVDHLSDLLKKHGQGSDLQNMKLHRTKCSSVMNNVISPSLFEELIEDVGTSSFSIILDESTDCSINKYLCLCIKYYSHRKNTILSRFLGLVRVEETTANALFGYLQFFLNEAGLSIKNMIGIGTDGANNLCGRKHSLFTLLKAENPNIQLVRCICHSLNNAASTSTDEMPASIEFLCREIFNWFSNSDLRRIQYRRLYDILNNEEKPFHNFVQLSSTRWLSRYNAVNIILEHYDELKSHFNIVVDSEKCYLARVIQEMMNDNTTILYFKIIHPIIFEVNKANLLFQRNDIDFGHVYNDLSNLIQTLASKIMKPLFLHGGIEKMIESYENPLAFLEPNECDFGIQYFRSLKNSKVTDVERNNVEFRCFNYIKRLLGQLTMRLPDHLKLFNNMRSFSPDFCLSATLKFPFAKLPFLHFIAEDCLFKVENQYKSLTNVNWKDTYGENILHNTADFWTTVIQHKDAGGSLAFKDLGKFVMTVLILPSSNAVVERVFSIMNAIKIKARNKLKLPMLSAIIRIRAENYNSSLCCTNFPITKTMMQKFNVNMYDFKHKNKDEAGDEEEVLEILDDEVPRLHII